MNLILASGSPRRRQLLTQIGLTNFTVRPADVDESVEPGLSPQEVVCALSRRKAAAVAKLCPGDWVLAADTVVSLQGAILGKPRDAAHAAQMLAHLSGRTHHVFTGLTLHPPAGEALTAWEDTAVTFRALSQEEIRRYVSTGEPLDKAGAYGIQGLAALFVSGISGDYSNVVGLPLCRLGQMLAQAGVSPWDFAQEG